ncbi:MAG: hypothetical protein QOI74_224 [Micromonosporaceae bacterium]|nr:hypothetical protein [Micromonosporaceae bacterium]
MTGVELLRAQPRDTDWLAQLVADAFHELVPSAWLVADPIVRREIFPGEYRLYVELGMLEGAVYTSADRAGAAIWVRHEPGGNPGVPDYDERLAAATGEHVDRFRIFDEVLAKHYPTVPTYAHLAILAVRRDRRRQGLGSALMSQYHRLLDEQQVPAYLEASDSGTRRLYLEHGYRDMGDPIELPEGPVMFPMWREPGQATHPEATEET